MIKSRLINVCYTDCEFRQSNFCNTIKFENCKNRIFKISVFKRLKKWFTNILNLYITKKPIFFMDI